MRLSKPPAARDASGRGPREAAARLAVESSNARTEPQRSEQLWVPVSMNFGPQIAARFSGRLPTTRCGEDDRRLLRFSNGFLIFSNRSVTHADRDGDPKLARLRC